MRTRHDLPIGWRLGAGFAAVLAVMTGFAVFMLASHQRSETIQREFTQRQVPLDEAGDALERALLYVGIGVRAHLLDPSPGTRRGAEERIARARDAVKRLGAMSPAPEDRAAVAAIAPPAEAYLAEATAIVANPPGDFTATERRLAGAREAALARVHALTDAQRAKRSAALEAMERTRGRLAAAGLVAFVLVLAILLVVGYYTLRSIQRPAKDLVRIANALRAGDWTPALEWSPQAVATRGERANPRSELARIAHAFGAAAVALDRREARLRADASVAAASASTLRRDAFAQAALAAIVEASGAHAGAFYAQDAGKLTSLAGIRLDTPEGTPLASHDMAQRACREGRVIVEGRAAAAAVPYRDETLGVVALAGLDTADDDTRGFLRAAAAQVAIGLANVRAHEHARALAEEVQLQNEEIQAQMEEIQAQSEQLQAQNEELQAQADQIAESNALLRRQTEELGRADERKNEFLALLAHELRNPLAAIGNSVFMLGHPQIQPAQAEQARAVIERQMRHLTRMIDDLLDVTRISRGKLRLQRERLDLAQVVREGVDDHRGAIDNAGLSLALRVPETPVPVVGDRVRLGQVLSNLLHNAVKFTPRGGQVEVALAPADRHASLRVADTGVGIESHLLAQLFEPFRQGENASAPANPGLGLGLALARALIDMHGGHIVAHSDGHGHGAEFVVTLPLEGASPVADGRKFVDTGRHRGIVSEDFEPRGE